MKIHFVSAFPRQCFCLGWQDFILTASGFTSATSAKTSTRSKLVGLLPLLHILPRTRSIMCTIIVVQILSYAMQCALLSCRKLSFKNNFRCFEFKRKNKYEIKMLNRLKRDFKRKICINGFFLMSQVLFFFGTCRWTNGKRLKQNESCLKMWRYRIWLIWWYKTWKQNLFHCYVNEEKEDG